jgi:asparagine synthase (glutamine-hydrolysing)
VLWPANVHFVALPAAEVAGGALITGVGGDGVLAAGQHDLMGRSRGRGAARDVARGLYRSLPARARMPREMNRLRAISPWLRPAATAAVARQAIAAPTEPRRCDARLDHIYRHRVNVLTREGVEVLCAERNVRAVTPYLDRAFLVSFARFLGRGGVGGRTAATRILADGLLPERLITRPTKAAFPEAYCNRHTREFVRRWQGGGLDEELVDCARLRSLWEEDALLWPARSAALLQAAWLAEAGASAAVAAGSLGHPHSDRNREPT